MYNALEGMDMKSVRKLTIHYLEQMVEANGIYKMTVNSDNIPVFNSIMTEYVKWPLPKHCQ